MSDDAAPSVEALSFEDALAELETVVGRLEEGKVPLEASIDLYQRGSALKARCEALLREAELKVSRIVSAGDQPVALEPAAVEAPRPAPAGDDDIPF